MAKKRKIGDALSSAAKAVRGNGDSPTQSLSNDKKNPADVSSDKPKKPKKEKEKKTKSNSDIDSSQLKKEVSKPSTQDSSTLGSMITRVSEDESKDGIVAKDKTYSPTINGKTPNVSVNSNVAQKADSYEEVSVAGALADAVQKVSDEVVDDSEKANLAEDAVIATSSGDAKKSGGDTKTSQSGYTGETRPIGKVASEGTGGYDVSYDLNDISSMKDDFEKQNKLRAAEAPAIAIEKLGIQQYFPPSEDYVRSNFQGRYIGSRTLVASGGALMPVGLYDARNRAIEAKAQAQAKAKQKFWDIIDTAPQYDERYKDIFMDGLDKWYEVSGGDIGALTRGDSKMSREFIRWHKQMESRGRDIKELDKYATDIVSRMNEGDEFFPPEVIKAAMDVRTAQYELEDYMEGKLDGKLRIREAKNMLRGFESFTKVANEQLKLLKDLGPENMPLAKDADFLDPQVAANAVDSIYRNIHRDYDQLISATSKFWDVNKIENIVDTLYREHNLYDGTTEAEREKILQSGVRYMLSNLPREIDVEQKFQKTDALGWAKHYELKRQFNLTREDKIKFNRTTWESQNDIMTNMKNEIEEAKKIKDPAERTKKVNEIMMKYNSSVVTRGGVVAARVPALGETVHAVAANEAMIISSFGDKDMVSPAEELERARAAYNAMPDGPEKEAMQEYAWSVRRFNELGANNINVQAKENFASFGVVDNNKGMIVPIEEYDGNNPNDKVVNMGHIGGAAIYETGDVDTETGERATETFPFTVVTSYNIETDPVRRRMESQESKSTKLSDEWEQTGYTGKNTTISSSSFNTNNQNK
jgi:hypothetical protein